MLVWAVDVWNLVSKPHTPQFEGMAALPLPAPAPRVCPPCRELCSQPCGSPTPLACPLLLLDQQATTGGRTAAA